MKIYIKPQLEYIEMRAEERLAVCNVIGSCPKLGDGLDPDVNGGVPDGMMDWVTAS